MMVVAWVAGGLEEVVALEAKRLSVKNRAREGRNYEAHTDRDQFPEVISAKPKGDSEIRDSGRFRIEEARSRSRRTGVRGSRTIRVTNNSVRADSIDNGVMSNNRTV